jgi:predicted permease
VIGVGPRTLNSTQSFALAATLWMPATRLEPRSTGASGAASPGLLEHRANLLLEVRARLREGLTVEQAQAAMDVTAERLAADYPDRDPKRGMTVLATDSVRVHPRQKILRVAAAVALTVVGLVLAIACSNLATLLLVRGSERSSEISVRLALGATRWQLVRHLLMESLVLSAAGTAAGVVIAHWGLRYLASLDLPLIVSMQLDYHVFGFAVAVAVLCGAGFGLTPALQITRADLSQALREQKGSSGRALSLARGWFTLKNVLLVGQVAASFLLLMGAALAISVLTVTQNRSVGFPTSGLAMVEADTGYAGYDVQRARAVFEELRRRIAELPGVESVFFTTGLPADPQFDRKLVLEGADDEDYLEVEGRWADPGYFETVGVPLLFGRVFNERDTPESPEVIVVNEAMARRYFGTPDAVGKRLRFADLDAQPVEIVGVVGNTRSIDMLAEVPQPLFYRSAAQAGQIPTAIVARTPRNDLALVGLMRQEVHRLHPELPVTASETMEQLHSKYLTPFRGAIVALGTLGALGLILAGVGLYSVVALAVAQRSNEIGIRVALGASPSDVTWLVVRDVTALVAAGIAIGSLLSWTGLAVFKSSVGSILGFDALTVALVGVIIAASGAAAAYVPARRAVLTDPVAAIRHE